MVTIPDPDIRGLNVQIAGLKTDRASILLESARVALIDATRDYLEYMKGGRQDSDTDAHLWARLGAVHETYEARLHMLLACEDALESQKLRALEEG